MARERPDRLADAVGAQCIPTPLAWFLHALPSVFLKLAVAATLLIELPAPFLLLAPFRAARLASGVDVYLPLRLAPDVLGKPEFKEKLLHGWRKCA